MSKNIRNIIAAIVIFSTFSVSAPNCVNFTLTKAYAEDKPSLRDMYFNAGTDIDFSKDKYSYILDLDEDIDEVYLRTKPEDPLDTVKVNGQIVTKEKYYRQNLQLEKGKNTINVEVIDDKTESVTSYKVYIYRGGKKAVYLKDISINQRTIGFDKTNFIYNIELDKEEQLVELKITPEEGKYSIAVKGIELSEKNSIKLKFNGIGKYIINIGFKDEDTERVGSYTVNIFYGISVSPDISASIENALKPNQWVFLFGRWRYNDDFGESLKDTWFYDTKYNGYFHFNKSGNMQTGWIEDGGKYYYLNSYGVMETGWIFDEELQEWYFLGSDGAMKIGWLKDGDNWYYLRRNGSMATGWIVSKDKWYYLNSNGIMRKGWIYYGKKWYYLNENGTMETGWVNIDNDWYYLNSDGSMKSGEWFSYKNNWYYLNYVGNMRIGWLNKDNKYYYFDEDGTMRNTPKTIDGYTYEFNEDGSVNFN